MADTLQAMTPASDIFLETIPEDQSVAQQRVQNLSAVGTVTQYENEVEVEGNSRNDIERASYLKNENHKKHHRSPASVTSSNNAMVGSSEIGLEESAAMKREESKSKEKSRGWTRRYTLCLVFWCLLSVGIAIAIYFIVSETGANDKADKAVSSTEGITPFPTPELTFPPQLFLEIDSDAPSAAPSVNFDTMNDIDDALLSVSSFEDYFDESEPQGRCRQWIMEQDNLQLKVSEHGEKAVQQRYILCVLYHSTNGSNWTETTRPFVDPSLHECDWRGISCDTSSQQVSVIYLAGVNMQGQIPSELNYLSNIQLLQFGENRMSGTIPSGLLELPNLILLDLSSNLLTGTIPSSISMQYSPLQALYLDDNRFQGTLPFFSMLERMRVQRNLFTGFDSQYSTSKSLRSWKMYDNAINSSLPQDWDAPNLKNVDLALNQLTGSIPDSLWNLPQLESLVLHHGQLTGTLPESVESNHWRFLMLQANSLGGTIPSKLASDWINVTAILLHDNQFTGEILETSCDQWPRLERLEMDCIRPNVTCECCTRCHP